MVAEKHGFDNNYVSHISEKDIRVFYPSTAGNRFINLPALQQPVEIVAVQHEIIRQLARQGDCVIAGRCAGVLCRDMSPARQPAGISSREICYRREKESIIL